MLKNWVAIFKGKVIVMSKLDYMVHFQKMSANGVQAIAFKIIVL